MTCWVLLHQYILQTGNGPWKERGTQTDGQNDNSIQLICSFNSLARRSNSLMTRELPEYLSWNIKDWS